LENVSARPVIYWDKKSSETSPRTLIGEEPLSIRIQGNPYAVVMRTPGDEIAHVAGFCLAEGVVDTISDLGAIAFCDQKDTNAVSVSLSESRHDKIPHLLERRGFISQTGCGLCGKELVEDLHQVIHPLADTIKLDAPRALDCLEGLSDQQPLRQQTRASHAAALYDQNFELLAAAEDVGRHNALDKAIGKLFLSQKLQSAVLLILSSRISYELVQKAARARIPVILAVSRPTTLAVDLASKLNIALACQAKSDGLFIFCAEHRLVL
jgi:FdhD protein